ncbi:helicase-exonuclease AddAB subunit AddB [Azotosporobacter soli]|uniref:helicase-exonuclease AddAB subunit AddB n=1 Tax=Azotosporobacter soli TaxID=3055040 RepID=UPI0031FE603E
MKLRIVMGRAGAGKTERCLEEIRERLRREPQGYPLLLILPEHATFQVEKELAATPDLGGFVRAYVFGFRRLAHRVLQEAGGIVRPQVTELGKRLIVGRLLREERARLKVFQQAAAQRSFPDTLLGLIREMKSYNLTPEALGAAAEKWDGHPLGDKLQDLALLYGELRDFLRESYSDPEDYLTLVAENIDRSTLLRESEVWLDGLTWFNPQEMAVIEAMLKTARQVTVTLCLDQADSPEHASETSLFHRQWNTRRKLRMLAARIGCEVEEIELTSAGRFAAAPLLAHLERRFWQMPLEKWTGGGLDALRLSEAVNRRGEVEAMARDIRRLCREENLRWREIGILLRDSNAYGDLVERVLGDFEIPFFSDRKRCPVHHPLAELLRSALEAVGRWHYEALFRCFKTDFFAPCRDEIDRLENYVLEFGIQGRQRWLGEEGWTFWRRLSLDEDRELDEDRAEYLLELNRIRLLAAAPLGRFDAAMGKAATVAERTEALYGLLETLNVAETLIAWADRAESDGRLEEALEHRQLWEHVVELLEQLVETCGEQAMNLEEYAALVGDGLEAMRLSLIPPGLDYVTVVSLEETSLTNLKVAYVPGVNEGVLPMRSKGEGLLSDAERAVLLDAGLELGTGVQGDVFAEQFLVYTALTRASHRVCLSYPLSDEEGKGLAPSPLIARLRQISGVPLLALPAEAIGEAALSYVEQPQRAISAMGGALRACLEGEELGALWRDVYNWALPKQEMQRPLRQALAGLFYRNEAEALTKEQARPLYMESGRRLRGSVTRFESFRSCPFQHFARYGLKLKERQVFKLAAPDLGQFFHAALKNFGLQLQAEKRDWGSVQEEECGALVGKIVEELAPRLQNEILFSSGRHRHLLQRLTRTVERAVRRLVEFDRVSSFKPAALEKSFGSGPDSFPPLVYMLSGDVALEVVGQIDRLDVARAKTDGQQFLLVIDYKSGGAWIKPADVYHGLRLQLLTYLLVALRAYPESLPAGVLYYFLRSPSLSGDGPLAAAEIERQLNQMLKMPGWVVAEPEVVNLLDGAMQGRSEFLKLALKADGSFYADCLPYVKSEEEFTAWLAHVESLVVETAQQILQGDIAISPYQLGDATPCGYCPYDSVCQFDQRLPENRYRRLAEQVPTPAAAGKEMEEKDGEDR